MNRHAATQAGTAAFNATMRGDMQGLRKALRPPYNAAEQVEYKDRVRSSNNRGAKQPKIAQS